MSAEVLKLDGTGLTLDDVEQVAAGGVTVSLTDTAVDAMLRSRRWVERALAERRVVYGVTTGFGSLADTPIAPEESALLSRNLVLSHAAGVGPECPPEVVRAMLLLRANTLARGASGCTLSLVQTLLALLNADVLPVVPRQGSCGSSGDLAPLSHLGLVVLGEPQGRARYQGQVMSAADALKKAGISPHLLSAKEGLALTNGAQLTTAIAVLASQQARRLIQTAELAAAMSIEALHGVTRAFHPDVHALRPYPGAKTTAARLRALLQGSELVNKPGKVQDAYSLRCTPVVLGACRDMLDFGQQMLQVEINAVTDNPVFLMDHDDDNDRAFSAGLFHGEPVGMAADTMKIAVAEVASLAERRLYRLTTESLSDALPAGLIHAERKGLGMLVPQTAAASLVSENKALGWPASMDSIPTSADQEDHVAMGTTAAWRLYEVVENTRRVIAIELLCAAEALRWRRDTEQKRLATATSAAMEAVLGLTAGLPTPAERIEAVAEHIRTTSLESA